MTIRNSSPVCKQQVACDGEDLVNPQARERGYCGRCKDVMAKRAKAPKREKGEPNHKIRVEDD